MTTNWGALEILKYADNDKSATLAGAKFEIYESRDGQPVGTLTTDANGKASISLWVGSNDVTSKDYHLKEIEAPAGYTPPQDPWTTVTVKAGGSSDPVLVQISNKQKDRGELPFTGANGQLMLTILGIALLRARDRRRRDALHPGPQGLRTTSPAEAALMPPPR